MKNEPDLVLCFPNFASIYPYLCFVISLFMYLYFPGNLFGISKEIWAAVFPDWEEVCD